MTTRSVLCAALSAASLVLALATAVVQSENHERGVALNALKEKCSMLEAVNGDRAAEILARDYGPLPIETPAHPELAALHVARPKGSAKP